MPNRVVVAIPVKNEEEHIGACLRGLLSQSVPADDILLFLNNCVDGTLPICETVRASHSNVHIVEKTLGPLLASAGEARRQALALGAGLAGDGVLFTTDADSIAPPDWIETALREMAKGADVVCGKAEISPAEAVLIPQSLQCDHLQECACFDLLDEIDSMVDPDLADPWPRHKQNSGAGIAMTTTIFRRAGGAPRVATGEDRALIEKLQRVDARIRHAPEIVITVSGRLEGRAAGGMADAIKRRMQQRDEFTDDRLEPAIDAYRRSLAKAASRAAWRDKNSAEDLAQDLLVSPDLMAQALRAHYFGAAWAEIQRLSPVLRRRRVAYDDLPRETKQAMQLRDQLKFELERAPLPRIFPMPMSYGREIAD